MADIKKITVEVRPVEFSEKKLITKSRILGIVFSIILALEEIVLEVVSGISSYIMSYVMILSISWVVFAFVIDIHGYSAWHYILKFFINCDDVYLFSSEDNIYENVDIPYEENTDINNDDFII